MSAVNVIVAAVGAALAKLPVKSFTGLMEVEWADGRKESVEVDTQGLIDALTGTVKPKATKATKDTASKTNKTKPKPKAKTEAKDTGEKSKRGWNEQLDFTKYIPLAECDLPHAQWTKLASVRKQSRRTGNWVEYAVKGIKGTAKDEHGTPLWVVLTAEWMDDPGTGMTVKASEVLVAKVFVEALRKAKAKAA